MLKELTIKNFTSFNNEVTFSMEADTDRVSEHPDHIVKINDNKLLRVASVYGPNGGGKSNLLKALTVAKSLLQGRTITSDCDLSCVFNDSGMIEEQLFFVNDDYEMGYSFNVKCVLDDDERSLISKYKPVDFSLEICNEVVVYRKHGEDEFVMLCTRDNGGAIVGDDFLALFENKGFRLGKSMSIVTYAYEMFANNDGLLPKQFEVIRELYREVCSITNLELTFDKPAEIPVRAISIAMKNKKQLTQMLNNVDIQIEGIRIDKISETDIFFVRKVNIDGKECERELPLSAESAGTRKMFWIFVWLIEAAKSNKIFYCDDMNAYLHPKLIRAIVEFFQSGNTRSQLIFNSHDIINMKGDLFRRDEIWFAYRDENYSSQLVPLSNIVNYKGEQVRKDATYYKQYLEGKYGADPFVARGLNWNE